MLHPPPASAALQSLRLSCACTIFVAPPLPFASVFNAFPSSPARPVSSNTQVGLPCNVSHQLSICITYKECQLVLSAVSTMHWQACDSVSTPLTSPVSSTLGEHEDRRTIYQSTNAPQKSETHAVMNTCFGLAICTSVEHPTQHHVTPADPTPEVWSLIHYTLSERAVICE
ncbi:unnamed protein product [Periconia digitata]|uniref:Uncharacterized protein n=1 Tax=Periconia digitata TaxID=1303443 RepID=A0A9W4UP46_9PLEO|nr:unnamed protein product [Periconia digitata]